MNIKINPTALSGAIQAPASKSVAHRMLICAALAKGKSKIKINKTAIIVIKVRELLFSFLLFFYLY